jgi:hypothetical protein
MVKPYIMVERSFNLECVLKLDTWGHKPRASKVSYYGWGGGRVGARGPCCAGACGASWGGP